MRQFLFGIGSAFALLAAGLLLWQLRADPKPDLPDPPPDPDALLADTDLPVAGADAPRLGPPLPDPPRAPKPSREERRFDRYDLDQNEQITRIELMSSRTKAFRKLDVNKDNLLSFEEWAVRTSEKFEGADADGNGRLTRAEFATTRPKRSPKPKCKC